MSDFIDKSTVARLIGFDSGDAFLRGRDRLENDHGFPAPMATCLRPLKWRRQAVEAWLEEQSMPAPPVIHGSNIVLMREARRA